ncbi:MAG: T9SS type A sorting domain-containing protein [Sphingobacteriales bacterium]|nr:T9SS type A sorting domain-containing protein [Sphingobacteriales bacterium]
MILRFSLLPVLFAAALLLFLATASVNIAAQPCTIFLDNLNNNISPPSGATICDNEPLILPPLEFIPGGAMPNPAVMWAIYSCQPESTDPSIDACNTLNVIVSNSDGPVYNDGTGDLSLAGLFTGNEPSITIVIVPLLTPDADGSLNYDSDCTGIDPNFDYPTYTVLNSAQNPILCNPNCNGSFVFNDECAGAQVFDIQNPVAINMPFSNECASAINSDPAGDCFFDNDPYLHTVWFSFTGTGGTYNIITKNCPGSVTPQLSDTQMAIYKGNSCGDYQLLACDDNTTLGTTYAGVNNFVTEPGVTYYIIVDGYDTNVGEFCFDVAEVSPPPCEDTSGTGNLETINPICQQDMFTVTVSGNNTSSEYITKILVYTADSPETLVGVYDVGSISAADFAPGQYKLVVINYALEVESDIADCLKPGASILCAALNNDCVSLSNVSGILTVLDPTDPLCTGCLADAGLGQNAMITECVGFMGNFIIADDNNDPLYATKIIVIDNSTNTILVIANEGETIAFDTPGQFAIFAVNYLKADEGKLLDLIEIGGFMTKLESAILENLLCADTVQYVVIEITNCCNANFGTPTLLTNAVVCPPDSPAGQEIVIAATGASETDYTTLYLVSNGAPLYTQQTYSLTGDGIVLPEGTWFIHTINVLNTDLPTVTNALDGGASALDLMDLINGGLCAVLDLAGVEVTVEPGNSYDCLLCSEVALDITTLDASAYCNDAVINIEAMATPLVTDGDYLTVFIVVPQGGDAITATSTAIAAPFSNAVLNLADLGLITGNYTVHTFTYYIDNQTDIEPLIAPGASITDLIAAIDAKTWCAYLDKTGAAFEILDPTSPDCTTVDCEANIGQIFPVDPIVTCDAGIFGFTADGDNTNGYSTYYLFTKDNQILEISTLGEFEYPAESGMYAIYGINFKSGEEAIILALTNIDDLDNLPDFCYAMGLGNAVVVTSLNVLDESTYNYDTDDFTITLLVTGGVETNGYTVIFNNDTSFEIASPDSILSIKSVPNKSVNTVEVINNITGCTQTLTIQLSAVLPINLLSFEGVAQPKGNLLQWQTATETQVTAYQINRLNAQGQWSLIGSLPVNGNSTTQRNYQLFDANPNNGVNYYQLVAIDNDGKYQNLATNQVERANSNYLMQLAFQQVCPVPFANVLNVDFTIDNTSFDKGNTMVEVNLYDISGRKVYSRQLTAQHSGLNSLQIPTQQLASGIYTLSVSNAQTTIVQKVVK